MLYGEKVPRFCIKKLRVLNFSVGVFVRNSNEHDFESLKMPEKTHRNLWKVLKSVQKWKCQSVSKNIGFAYSQVVVAKGEETVSGVDFLCILKKCCTFVA